MQKSGKRKTRKTQILEAALQLFSQKGVHGVSTKEIAAEAGVAEGLIFYHFKDKKGLLAALIRQFSFRGVLEPHLAELAALNPEEGLVRLGQMYLGFLHDHAAWVALLWSPDLVGDESVNEELGTMLSGMADAVGALLAPCAEGDPERLALVPTVVTMMLSGWMTHYMLGARFGEEDLKNDEAYIRETVHVALRALRGLQR